MGERQRQMWEVLIVTCHLSLVSLLEKINEIYFALYSLNRIVDFVEYRLRFGNIQINLVFRSPCTIFAANKQIFYYDKRSNEP